MPRVRSTSGAGVASGYELAYASRSAAFAPGNGTLQDIPGLSLTFVAPARPFELKLWIPAVYSTAANGVIAVQITDDANTVLAEGRYADSAANMYQGNASVEAVIRDAVAGATKTYKGRIQGLVGNLGILGSVAGSVAYFQAKTV